MDKKKDKKYFFEGFTLPFSKKSNSEGATSKSNSPKKFEIIHLYASCQDISQLGTLPEEEGVRTKRALSDITIIPKDHLPPRLRLDSDPTFSGRIGKLPSSLSQPVTPKSYYSPTTPKMPDSAAIFSPSDSSGSEIHNVGTKLIPPRLNSSLESISSISPVNKTSPFSTPTSHITATTTTSAIDEAQRNSEDEYTFIPDSRPNSILMPLSPHECEESLKALIRYAFKFGIHLGKIQELVTTLNEEFINATEKNQIDSTGDISVASSKSDKPDTLSYAWYKKGKEAASEALYSKSIEFYTKALEESNSPKPEDIPKYYNRIAQSYDLLGSMKKAEETCNNIISNYPDFKEVYKTLAVIYRHEYTHLKDAGNFPQAATYKDKAQQSLQQYKKLTHNNPKGVYEYYIEKGLMGLEAGEPIEHLSECLIHAETQMHRHHDSMRNKTTRSSKKYESKLEFLNNIKNYTLIEIPEEDSDLPKPRRPSHELAEEQRKVMRNALEGLTLSPQEEKLKALTLALQTEMEKLTNKINALEANSVKREEVSIAIKNNPCLEKEQAEKQKIQNNPKVLEYYTYFKQTCESAYLSAQLITGNQVTLNTDYEIPKLMLRKALELVPICGTILGQVANTIITAKSEKTLQYKAALLLKMAPTVQDFYNIIEPAARAITLTHAKEQQILHPPADTISSGIFSVMHQKLTKLESTISNTLYPTKHLTEAELLARTDAYNVIIEFVKYQQKLATDPQLSPLNDHEIIGLITHIAIGNTSLLSASMPHLAISSSVAELDTYSDDDIEFPEVPTTGHSYHFSSV